MHNDIFGYVKHPKSIQFSIAMRKLPQGNVQHELHTMGMDQNHGTYLCSRQNRWDLWMSNEVNLWSPAVSAPSGSNSK